MSDQIRMFFFYVVIIVDELSLENLFIFQGCLINENVSENDISLFMNTTQNSYIEYINRYSFIKKNKNKSH